LATLHGLLATLGECRVAAQLPATRLLVFPHSIDFSGNALSHSRSACDFNVLPPLCLISLCHLMTWG
jgi:hypothetical protein